ncbi:putative leucine-rich repeat protein [Trypanosoma rangeli]|uniref:Putative leucine-rich repeat protein n=1 Tax=Trypanosoma rangeli TaxID=5698 RepID=A0A3R7N675_TRYRA|nr:putative leucine-rich repeat protein [Trypanosoma rangeli]RNF00887.1 putative leucine-rich repeat protein [Trypanosoma rangeli]|eukprot:RNF00887.1 putative leucine-rich repeat protein [Trypanosoma rangeli]
MTDEQKKTFVKLNEKTTQPLYNSPEKSSKSGGRVGNSARAKEKNERKERVDEATHTEGRINVGATVYTRFMQHDKSGVFGGGQVAVWVQEGKAVEQGWGEMLLESGDVVYAKLDDPAVTRWELPDATSLQSDATAVMKTFTPRKEWPEPLQAVVWVEAAKALDECFMSSGDVDNATEVERSNMVHSIANTYMATCGVEGHDQNLQKWLHHAALAEFESFLKRRHATAAANQTVNRRAATLLLQGTLGPVERVVREVGNKSAATTTVTAVDSTQDGNNNEMRTEALLPSPSSPFLPQAKFLLNPYYANLLRHPSARRSCIESRLEATTFAAVGSGEVRVLCAVAAYEGHKGPKKRLFAVARDWTGAFAFFVLEPFNDTTEAVVLDSYPLLGSVDMNPESHQRMAFHVDGVKFVASFKDNETARWLHDALKASMAFMYGEGSDSERIVKMRAYSVEFAAQYACEDSTALELMTAILSVSDDCDGTLMERRFAQLRRCLRTAEGRDTVALQWLSSVKKLTSKNSVSTTTMSTANHLHVVEVFIQCPTRHTDARLSQRMYEGIEDMGRHTPEIMATCSRLAVLLDYTDRVMQTWSSRHVVPDVPFEPCFKPESHSPAAFYEAAMLNERRTRGEAYRLSSGIYLVVICFCGEKVFTDTSGNWVAEAVQHGPTLEELQQIAADSESYRWMLRLGGTDANWANKENLETWEALYKERGGDSFKARFIRAASRLRDRGVFPRLGCLFDTPIFQEEVGTALILTLCEVDAETEVSPAAGVWRNLCDVEASIYTQSLMCSENARVRFLPTGYRRCVRYLSAAVEYQMSLARRLSPGFYVGFFLTTVSTEGMLMLVPECNRNLPPLVKVSDEPPSLPQWRWLQSLNYRRQTAQNFGLPTLRDLFTPLNADAPFESKVAYAVAALEAAVGLKIEQFYDLDLFALNEEQTIYTFFAVAYYPPPLQGVERVPAAPKGLVPMTFKLVRLVDDHHQRRYWSAVYGSLADEGDRAYRMLCSTTQPFTSDEAIRLKTANEAMLYAMELDRYALLFSWARELAIWLETDAQTLVQRYTGWPVKTSAANTVNEEKARESASSGTSHSVEEVVDIAVSNQTSSTDPRLPAMKSLLLQLRSTGEKGWGNVLQRLQEMDSAVTERYAGEEASAAEANKLSLTLRGFDDVPLDDGFFAARPATVYELPCTLMEFVLNEGNIDDSYLFVREIVDDVIELAAAGIAVAALGRITETMVSCVEVAEDMLDGAALEALRLEAEEKAWTERQAFLKRWSGMLNARLAPSMLDELEAPVEDLEPIFYAGSSQYIRSGNDGLRVCLARAASDANQLQELLRVANSALHGLELNQCIHAYNNAFQENGQTLFNDRPGKKEQRVHRGEAATAPIPTPAPQLVTLVSREHREIHLYSLDPLRCFLLQGDQTRVAFPELGYAELKVLGDHMNAPPLELASQLRDLRPTDEQQRQKLLSMSLELQVPLLAIRLLPLVYCPETGNFGEKEANAARKALTGRDFFFLYSVQDWFRMELLGGPATLSGFDVLWWLRYLQEMGEEEEAYNTYSGAWKQVYAEARVCVQLSRGVDCVAEEEVLLWREELGYLVAYMSFRGKANITDAEVTVLVETCPQLQSLDLSGTAVTDESVHLLCTRCKRLVECNVMGCRVSCDAAIHLTDFCRRNVQSV